MILIESAGYDSISNHKDAGYGDIGYAPDTHFFNIFLQHYYDCVARKKSHISLYILFNDLLSRNVSAIGRFLLLKYFFLKNRINDLPN